MPTLEFKGKQHIYAHHLTVPYRPLESDESRSCNPTDEDDNLIIHGDNLHALKALLPRYANRIKCIYIDPPYNTGNEGWVYNDNVNSPLMQQWLTEHTPIDNEDLERHDKWLCMMWPRLHLLKELLADDGVIFVSIDNNEQHHLRMLMNEIFGGENFIESLIWRSRLGRGATAKNTATLHEYIIAYAKDTALVEFKEDRRIRETESKERLRQWGQGDRREDRPTMYYPIHSEEFGEIYPIRPDGTDGRWRVAQPTMENLIENSLVVFERQPDGRIEAYKIIPAGTETYTAYPSLLDSEIVKTTAHGSIELRNILEPNAFSYPKPSSLIKEIISLCTQKGDIILDSFAGSGTTAHAVLSLNKEDAGNRKFILIECEDYADTITAERVRRVISGIPDARDDALREGLGGTFTYCTLGDPIEVETMLTGEALPSYSALAANLLYTTVGVSVGANTLEAQNDNGLFHSDAKNDYYLIYKPNLEYLRSNAAILNLERAERLCNASRENGKKAIVYAAGNYIGQRELTRMGIIFCQLPDALHER